MEDPANKDRSSLLSEISNEMVRLYKEQFGRGPTRVRSDWAGPDLLVVTLTDSLTPAERNLVAMGEHQRLREARLFVQHASERAFRDIVERLVGREVHGFISGIDTTTDISAELFYLVPTAR